jgi:glycosyltransferase involved in cell wall biosynthesis
MGGKQSGYIKKSKYFKYGKQIVPKTAPTIKLARKQQPTIISQSMNERDRLRIYGLPKKTETPVLPVSDNKKPISIIITAYQTQNFIEECLNSIENQTYFKDNNNFEVLVGVDACQDTLNKLLEIRHKYRNLQIFMMNSNMGTYVTTNTLLDLVKYENIIRFDSDDVMKLEMINEIMSCANNYDLIQFGFSDFSDNIGGAYDSPLSHACGAVFYKKHIFDIMGGYQNWVCAADSELLMRISGHVTLGQINKRLFYRRSHKNSLTRKIGLDFRNKLKNESNSTEKIKIDKVVNKYNIIEPIIESKEPISIIITAYQTQDFIEECLDSIENQTYFINNDDFEVLVGVDACQNTLNKLLEIRHKYRNLRILMMNSNMGTYVTSNTLLDLVKYENIFRFDSDDIMCPGMVKEIMEFNNNNNYDLIRYKIKNFGDYQNNTEEKYAVGTMFFKKNIFKIFGGWESWICGADNELFKRIELHVKIGYLDKILCNRRIHPQSLTRKIETCGSSTIRTNYNNIVSNNNYNNIIFLDKTTNIYNEIKPKISFIYDFEGWAFYNMATKIKEYLTNYNIDIIKYDEFKNQNYYDAIITFSPRVLPKNISNTNNVICGISSHFGDFGDVVKKFSFVFTNDIKIFEQLNSLNKYYAPNGVDTKFFSQKEERKIKNVINVASLGSSYRSEHKGEKRIEIICDKLKILGYNVCNKSLFIDSKKKILSKEEIKEFYKNIDIFIISSVSETGPNPLLEAMSMGIPVISNNVGLANKLIKNGITGYLIDDYEKIDEYVLAIESLINNENIYFKISKNCKIKIKEYDWSEKSKIFKYIINDFLKRKTQ